MLNNLYGIFGKSQEVLKANVLLKINIINKTVKNYNDDIDNAIVNNHQYNYYTNSPLFSRKEAMLKLKSFMIMTTLLNLRHASFIREMNIKIEWQSFSEDMQEIAGIVHQANESNLPWRELIDNVLPDHLKIFSKDRK